MGCIKFFSSSSNDRECYKYPDGIEFKPSPLLKNYKILHYVEINNNLVIFINYKDVSNYEGNKILVYKNCNLIQLTEQGLIDPHFAEDKTLFSPIARFEPTEYGWGLALFTANKINATIK